MHAFIKIPLQPEFEHDCRSPPAGCVHTGDAAMISVFHFVDLCSKCEAGCVHPSPWTETAVFCPEVSNVSGQPHHRKINSHLFGREKKDDLPEQIHKNYKLSRQEVDGFYSKWLISIVLGMIFCFFFPFLLASPLRMCMDLVNLTSAPYLR